MPYIVKEQRDELDFRPPRNPGELTYLLYTTVQQYLGDDIRFEDIADVLGSLEATKLELYRRVVVPYEQRKIQQNGDVT